MRYLFLLIFSFPLPSTPSTTARVDDPVVFETWEDYVSRYTKHRDSRQKTRPPARIAKSSVVGQINHDSAKESQIEADPPTVEKRSEDSPEEYLVHFGAGARWLMAVRTSDASAADSVLSVFSASLSPYGIVGEIGIDLALGKDSSFFLSPNLKFYFVKHEIISVYLEGAFVLYSQSSGTHYGGGAGLGIVGGLMQHLSIELRAAAVLLNLNDAESAALLDMTADPSTGSNALIVCPSVEARLMARF